MVTKEQAMTCNIKPLPCPVQTIIELTIKTWWDKSAGNTYSSARVTVNNDSINTLYFACSNNTPENLKGIALRAVGAAYPDLSCLQQHCYESDLLKQGIYINTQISTATHAECRRWGIASAQEQRT